MRWDCIRETFENRGHRQEEDDLEVNGLLANKCFMWILFCAHSGIVNCKSLGSLERSHGLAGMTAGQQGPKVCILHSSPRIFLFSLGHPFASKGCWEGTRETVLCVVHTRWNALAPLATTSRRFVFGGCSFRHHQHLARVFAHFFFSWGVGEQTTTRTTN
jgi:hypothetical protein